MTKKNCKKNQIDDEMMSLIWDIEQRYSFLNYALGEFIKNFEDMKHSIYISIRNDITDSEKQDLEILKMCKYLKSFVDDLEYEVKEFDTIVDEFLISALKPKNKKEAI